MKSGYESRGYRTTETTVYCCRCHIVFCPRYRKKVLTPQIAKRMKETIEGMGGDNNFRIIEMEVMPDHVHMLLDIDPAIGICKAVSRIKGKTSHVLRREYPELSRKLPTLWTRSKFIATVGSVSLDVVKAYIENQNSQ